MELDPAYYFVLRFFGCIIGVVIAWDWARRLLHWIDRELDKKFNARFPGLKKPVRFDDLSHWLGMTECFLFLMLTAWDVNGLGSAVGAYIGLKMVAGWNSIKAAGDEDHPFRFLRFKALIKSMVSVGMAVLGGMFCSGKIIHPFIRETSTPVEQRIIIVTTPEPVRV